MSIVTPIVQYFPIPRDCNSCCGKLHKHGERDRHVIEREINWYPVQRMRCSECGSTCTILRVNMLPYQHYAAYEIEQVLQKQEDPTAPSCECGAEESTIRRWKREFPEKLSAMAAYLESVVNVTRICILPPLKRIYNALANLFHPPQNESRLAWAFFISKSHPVCVE